MARQKNDGRGRLGGRQRGTPNKVTTSVKVWIAELIDKNRAQIEQDLMQVEPKERLQFVEKLFQYVIPKQQAISAEVDVEQLTDSQLDELITNITNSIEDDTAN